jgi:protein-tyrosine phosphatase
MNILFVCSRNNWRSTTAETIYKSRQDHKVKSAGTEPSAKIRVSSKDILWADIIFTMEKKHKQRLLDKFPSETKNKQLIVLDIEDDYEYMDKELVEMIKLSVDPHL